MDIQLTPHEARVIGCLIEKEITTPEQYPLSLNALTNACNQKSNREPVLSLDEPTVQATIDALIKKHLASAKSGYGSRVAKYVHRFCNVDYEPLKFSPQELGIVCVLLLRGPRTPGELRTQTNRLCSFADAQEVETTLQQLMDRPDGPFVTRLPREAGKREARYAHLFSGEVLAAETYEPCQPMTASSPSDHERLDRLEQLIDELRLEIEQLKERLM